MEGFTENEPIQFCRSSAEIIISAIKEQQKKGASVTRYPIFRLVGTAGFEPATPTPPVWCATRLRYAPKQPVQAERRIILAAACYATSDLNSSGIRLTDN